jgi:hypothetical protein
MQAFYNYRSQTDEEFRCEFKCNDRHVSKHRLNIAQWFFLFFSIALPSSPGIFSEGSDAVFALNNGRLTELEARKELFLMGGLPYSGETVTYDSLGNIVARGQMSFGMKDGPWTVYRPNGDIKSTGLYCQNRRCGEWRSSYDDLSTWKTEQFSVSGGRSKVSKFYNGSEALWVEYEMLDGKMDGNHTEYFPNGAVFRKMTFHEGFETEFREYNVAGQLILHKQFCADKQGFYPQVVRRYENGALKSEQHFIRKGNSMVEVTN